MESTTIDLAAWLEWASGRLTGVDRPTAEARLILQSVLNLSRAAVATHPERTLTPDQQRRLVETLDRRIAGEPLPYILGHWEFFGLDFLVTPAVLIPRPETELMVESALHWLKTHPGRRRVADVGVGSGAISIALAHAIHDLRVLGTDLSFAALRIAALNIQRQHMEARFALAQMDLLTAAAGSFDLICANLPYIPTRELQDLAVARVEPLQALDGGPNGLVHIGRLLADSSRWLAPGGRMLLEIEAGQGQSALDLARAVLPSAAISVMPDLSGKPRLMRIDI